MKTSKIFIITSVILSTFSSISAYATTATITFTAAANAANIPTLSTTMLVILSLLLFVVAIRVTKQKQLKNGKYFVLFIGLGLISAVTMNFNYLSTANAGIASNPIDLSPGNSVTYPGISSGSYTNNSGVPLSISIVVESTSQCLAGGVQCIDAGTFNGTLEVGDTCALNCLAIEVGPS